MDQLSRKHQQPRSNSISGHDFHMANVYSRSNKQSNFTHQNPYAEQYYGDRTMHSFLQTHSPYIDRSTSPMSTGGRILNYGEQNGHNNLHCAEKQPKNQLHASLECLNTTYSEYGQHHSRYQTTQAQLMQQQYQQQLQSQFKHNQHYAASYVLTAAPAETVINPHSDQDLAAAAMGSPPYQQKHQQHYNSTNQNHLGLSHNTYLAQSLINRNVVNASPLRRLGLNASSGTANITPTNVMNHLTNNSTPIRAGHSSLSLASSTLLIEDKLQNEIKKLQSELKSEKEKNEALNSQLNINSNLMAAFEQSLTTLNSRLRQISAMNEKKDQEIEELKKMLERSKLAPINCTSEQGTSPVGELVPNQEHTNVSDQLSRTASPIHETTNRSKLSAKESEQGLLRIIEDLKRQLIEKDRLLTDTRLEALSAAHQLEQLESKLNGEHSLLANEDDLDEGVMVINHSPSDSEAINDTAHFSEVNNQMVRATNNNKDVNQNASACNSRTSTNSYDDMREAQDRVHMQHLHSDDCSPGDCHGDAKSQDHTDTSSCRQDLKPSLDPLLDDTMSRLFDNVSIEN